MAKKKKKKAEDEIVEYKLPLALGEVCVKLVPGLKDNDDIWGQFTDEDGIPTIELDAGIRGDALKSTLMHEAFHMTFHISGISHLLEDRHEEVVVRSLENIFIPALPSLLAILDKLNERPDNAN